MLFQVAVQSVRSFAPLVLSENDHKSKVMARVRSPSRGTERRIDIPALTTPPTALPEWFADVTNVDVAECETHLSFMPKHEKNEIEFLRTWTLTPAATLGSSVRAKGILLEMRARLPVPSKKSLILEGNELILSMSANAKTEFQAASTIVSRALEDIETLPVIPREIQDILTIKTSERHRWLSDGRLPSAGTRTVKLRGRAKKITFHVFDPKVVEDILDRGVVEEWREHDATAAADNRRRAAYKAKLTRSLKQRAKTSPPTQAVSDEASNLSGWDEFGRDGFLR